MRANLIMLVIPVVFMCILMSGCTGLNSPPKVKLELVENESDTGPVPFYIPRMTYNCWDSDDNLELCEIISDSKVIYSSPELPDADLVPWPKYTTPGKHTLAIRATDSEGETNETSLTFNVLPAPPVVVLDAKVTSGRVPFSPYHQANISAFCYDYENKLTYCEINVDDKLLTKTPDMKNGTFDDGKIWYGYDYPDSYYTFPIFRDGGKHTMTMLARNSYNLTTNKTLVFDVDEKIEVYTMPLPSGVDNSYVGVVRDSFVPWENMHKVNFVETRDPEQSDYVTIEWTKEYMGGIEGSDSSALGRAFGEKNFIIVGLGDSNCYEKFRPYTYNSVKAIVTHELGHVMAYGHVWDDEWSDPNAPMDLMGSHELKYSVDVDQEEILAAGWSAWRPHCSRSNASTVTYRFEVTSDRPIDIYVVPSSEEYEKGTDGNAFTYYTNCYAENSYSMSKTCTISEKGGLYIHNPDSYNAARVHYKLTEQ